LLEDGANGGESDAAGAKALRPVRRLLAHSGIETRRWSSPDETPIHMLAEAIARAAGDAGAPLSDVDVLIYTGVGGGFSELGNAYMVAHALGDAGRAVLRHTGRVQQLVQGVAVPRERANDEWEFFFSSRTELADLCVIPEANYRGYCAIGLPGHGEVPTARIGQNGPQRFTSFAAALSAAAPEAIDVFRRLTVPRDSIRMILPHASSKRDWDDGADVLGIRDRLFHIHPEYGNVLSASVPAGLVLALEGGQIERGDRLAT
jgi:acyl-CoA:acyl-CoA alkyltransferase